MQACSKALSPKNLTVSPKDSKMASKSSCHVRSISLPSRPHPVADQFEEQLCRLRSSESASTSSSSLSHKLSSISNLYHCVDELLQLPLTQQTLCQNAHGKWVEEVLDGSLSQLDLCDMSRDILVQSKGCLQDVQSVQQKQFLQFLCLSLFPEDQEMASKTSCHVRSISLPSRPHPVAHQFEEQLCRLRSSQSASTSSSSLSHKLSSLSNLYHCVDDFLQLPLTQQTLSQSIHGKSVEEVLDGFLNLLDFCDMSREILVQSKGCLREIQSVLRRRCSGELSIANEVTEYLKIRKMAKKTITKCLKNIKETDKCNEENDMERILKDVEQISIDGFKQLLSYISGVNLKSRRSIFTKFTHKCAENKMSEFDAVDAAINSLACQKKKSGIDMSQIENMRSQIMKLESHIQDLVEELDCLSRHLVKSRAHLLNIFSN